MVLEKKKKKKKKIGKPELKKIEFIQKDLDT